MTKKTNTVNTEIHKDKLIKPNEQFKSELDKRIEMGKNLLTRLTTEDLNPPNLDRSKKEFEIWDDYNAELLKQSFDRVNNDYHRDYCSSGIVFGTLGGFTTILDSYNEHKSELEKQLGRIKKVREKVDLIETKAVQPAIIKEKDSTTTALDKLVNIFGKFHRIAQSLRNRHSTRPTLTIADEYDVQDLLRALLKEHFDDVREEDYVPSYAGSNSRVDFTLKNEKIVIETKMTSDKLKDKEAGSQLLIDIGRYKNHPDCNVLVLFIYDKGDFIVNKPGIIKDLDNMSANGLTVRTFINPE